MSNPIHTPFGSFPSKRAAAIALALSGMAPAAIAPLVGSTAASVGVELSRARARGVPIERFVSLSPPRRVVAFRSWKPTGAPASAGAARGALMSRALSEPRFRLVDAEGGYVHGLDLSRRTRERPWAWLGFADQLATVRRRHPEWCLRHWGAGRVAVVPFTPAVKPVRLQLSRGAARRARGRTGAAGGAARGFDLKALSRATNGLDVVVVTRRTPWGNPYVVGGAVDRKQLRRWGWRFAHPEFVAPDNETAVRRFAACLGMDEAIHAHVRAELRGKNLACWCGPDERCHADALLAVANAGGA